MDRRTGERRPCDIEGNAKRDPTRREHFVELLQEYGWQNFGLQPTGRCRLG